MATAVTNTSVILNWSHPGGTVNQYLVQYFRTNTQQIITVLVSGSITSSILMDLERGTSYDVAIIVINSNGFSAPSPVATFVTESEFQLV
jgi:hypothetical protein